MLADYSRSYEAPPALFVARFMHQHREQNILYETKVFNSDCPFDKHHILVNKIHAYMMLLQKLIKTSFNNMQLVVFVTFLESDKILSALLSVSTCFRRNCFYMSRGSSHNGSNATCNVVISFINSQKPMDWVKN
jgi:hypothetical protein